MGIPSAYHELCNCEYCQKILTIWMEKREAGMSEILDTPFGNMTDQIRQLESKYEGYLQKLRDDWKADSGERQAYIEKLESENKRLHLALVRIRDYEPHPSHCDHIHEICKSALEEKKA